MVDSSREAFEKWAVKNLPKVVGPIDWQMWLECWQASRSAAIEECAEACKLIAVACEDVYDGMQQIEQAAREAANECAAAILALKGEG